MRRPLASASLVIGDEVVVAGARGDLRRMVTEISGTTPHRGMVSSAETKKNKRGKSVSNKTFTISPLRARQRGGASPTVHIVSRFSCSWRAT